MWQGRKWEGEMVQPQGRTAWAPQPSAGRGRAVGAGGQKGAPKAPKTDGTQSEVVRTLTSPVCSLICLFHEDLLSTY